MYIYINIYILIYILKYILPIAYCLFPIGYSLLAIPYECFDGKSSQILAKVEGVIADLHFCQDGNCSDPSSVLEGVFADHLHHPAEHEGDVTASQPLYAALVYQLNIVDGDLLTW